MHELNLNCYILKQNHHHHLVALIVAPAPHDPIQTINRWMYYQLSNFPAVHRAGNNNKEIQYSPLTGKQSNFMTLNLVQCQSQQQLLKCAPPRGVIGELNLTAQAQSSH